MAKKVRFELDIKGLQGLMKSEWMQGHLDSAGKAVANSAGSNYSQRTHVASYVAITNVYPNSKEAAKENYKHNTLIKALSSAGLPMEKS